MQSRRLLGKEPEFCVVIFLTGRKQRTRQQGQGSFLVPSTLHPLPLTCYYLSQVGVTRKPERDLHLWGAALQCMHPKLPCHCPESPLSAVSSLPSPPTWQALGLLALVSYGSSSLKLSCEVRRFPSVPSWAPFTLLSQSLCGL